MFNKILKKARTIFGHIVIHPFVLICTLWTSGLIISFITNEYRAIGLDLNAIAIAYKWASWLLHSWTKLSFEAYDYIKIKLVLALIAPLSFVTLFYVKNFTRIKTLEFFLPKEAVYWFS